MKTSGTRCHGEASSPCLASRTRHECPTQRTCMNKCWKYYMNIDFKTGWNQCTVLSVYHYYFTRRLGLVGCGLTSHSAMFHLHSDGTVVQFPNLDLLPGTHRHGQLGVFSVPSLPRHGHRDIKTRFKPPCHQRAHTRWGYAGSPARYLYATVVGRGFGSSGGVFEPMGRLRKYCPTQTLVGNAFLSSFSWESMI